MKNGRSVIIFPEGTRGDGKRLLPFKPGGFDIALKAKVPIVPFVIKGTSYVMPKGSFSVKPSDIEVHFLDPIRTDGLKPKDRDSLSQTIREKMEEVLLEG